MYPNGTNETYIYLYIIPTSCGEVLLGNQSKLDITGWYPISKLFANNLIKKALEIYV